MGDTNDMARPADQALVSDQAASRLPPAGFDPSRWRSNSYEGKPRHIPKAERKELDKLLAAGREYIEGLTPYRRALLAKAVRSVSPVNCGWQHFKLAEVFVFELHRDSDRSGEASETAQAGSTVGESAGLEEASPTQSGQE